MTDGKVNVMHLVLSLEVGGMERFIYEHCLEIDKDRFNVSVCCLDRLGGFAEELLERGIKVDLFQRRQDRFDWFFPFKLKGFLKKNKIHILHIHSGAFFLGSVGSWLAKTPGIIYTEHGRHFIEPKILYFLDKVSSLFADKLITVSHSLEEYLIKEMKLPAKKVLTVINGVNTDKFQPRKKPEKLLNEFGINSETKIVGTVGRLAEVKDHSSLIQSFVGVRKVIPDSKLVLVGEGSCEQDLKNLVGQLSLTESVMFAGSRNDIPDLMNLFDVFVLPSLSEGMSLSLLEAMSSGVAPVVTNVGGNPNIVENDHHGYVVEPRDVSSIEKHILDILMNPITLEKFSENARREIVENYSIKKNVEKYQQIYLDLSS